MERTLLPELLDSLDPEDPAARHNRRDLRIINGILGSTRWFRRALAGRVRPGERVLELGAGTGELGAALGRHGLAWDGLDLWPRPPAWPAAQLWHRADLRTFDGYAAYGVVAGSLILHQFSAADLAAMGRRLGAGPRLLLFSEPARTRTSQLFCRVFLPLLGANHVSRHDAHVSIGSGFRHQELPQLLGLDPRVWSWRCSATTLGAYRMHAWRLAAPSAVPTP